MSDELDAKLDEILNWKNRAESEFRALAPGLDFTDSTWVQENVGRIKSKHLDEAKAAFRTLLIEARIDENKHALMNYWDDETDSIPCSDLETRIKELQALKDKQLSKGQDNE